MLRNAIFWGVPQAPSNAQIRTAAAQWNGKPVTCLLVARDLRPGSQSLSRSWEEEEFCIDNAAGLLQIHSFAPGTYTVYGYAGGIQFHGMSLPDQITIYVAGAAVVSAHFSIADAVSVGESPLTPTTEMESNRAVIGLMLPMRTTRDVPGASNSGSIQPVVVHVQLNGVGNVLEAELSAASDPALSQRAIDVIKKSRFPGPARPYQQQDLYVQVRFLPATPP